MKSLLSLVVILALASSSFATHFRYQTLYWQRASASSRTVTATLVQAWRWSFFDNPPVNQTVLIGTFRWGDSTTTTIQATVTSVNPVDDWMTVEQVMTHAYRGTATTFVAYYSDCCRISTLKDDNNDRSLNISTTIKLGANDPLRSPQIASLPLIPFTINEVNLVQIPFIQDEQNNAVQFSVTPASSSGSALLVPQPSPQYGPFSFSAAGIITWQPNTTGLYAFQCTAASGGNTVTLDVILHVSTARTDTTPPYWTAPTTGTQLVIRFTPGQVVTFPVAAQEDEVDDVRVQPGNMPPGATLTGCQGASVNGLFNPCSTTFTWPTTTSSGSVIVCFSAQDAAGNEAPQLCVSLIADAPANSPCADGNCTTRAVASSCANAGSPVSSHGSGKCAILSFTGTSTQC